MYEIRGSSGSKVVDEDTLKRFYTKKESFKAGDEVVLRTGQNGIILGDARFGKFTIKLSDGREVEYGPEFILDKESYKEKLKRLKESPRVCFNCHDKTAGPMYRWYHGDQDD